MMSSDKFDTIYYEDDNDSRGRLVASSVPEREARAAAARSLGHKNLRGAGFWASVSGTVYHFGPRTQDGDYPTAEVRRAL